MPSVVDGRTLIAGCDGYLRVVNIRDGTEQTQVELSDYVGASAAVLDGRAYVGTFGNQVLCIDLERSEVLWQYEHPKRRFPFYASPAVTAGGVVVGGRDRMVHALDPQTGKPLWTYATGSRIDSSPVIVGNRIFVGTMGGAILALGLFTGEPDWTFVTGSSIVASPSVAAGKLVIGSVDGILYCFGERQNDE